MSLNRIITVYGSYGHTGRFVVAELDKRGWKPILSGRDSEKLDAFGAEYRGLEVRVASVENPNSLDHALADAIAVINCAGPFAETAGPVIEAALRAKIPCLDVAAEVEVAAAAFENYSKKAREAGVVIIPSIGFYGGLGDLLVTAATGDWQTLDEISLAYALDSWKPTVGTRNTIQTSKRRRDGRRLVFRNGRMEYRTDDAPISDWNFPAPFGTQTVVGEFTTADSVTIPQHLKTSQINTYMTLEPLKDLSDPDLSSPTPIDKSGRSSQTFLVEAVVRLANEERRAVASGQDIYAVTAPLVVEAIERVITRQKEITGVVSAGEIFDAAAFLKSLCPEHLQIEV